jgi:hypothetical protein
MILKWMDLDGTIFICLVISISHIARVIYWFMLFDANR